MSGHITIEPARLMPSRKSGLVARVVVVARIAPASLVHIVEHRAVPLITYLGPEPVTTSVGKHHFSVNTPVEVDDPRYVSMLAANWFFRVEPEPVVSATADVIGCSEEAAPMEHQPMEPAPAPVEPAEAFEADPHPKSYLLTDVITALDLADAQALDLLRVLDAPSQDAPVVRRTRRRKMPRCNARTRRGTACQCQAVPGKRRCRLHGGLSTGAKTLEGRARIADGQRRRWAAWRNERLGGGARCGLAAPDTRGASDH